MERRVFLKRTGAAAAAAAMGALARPAISQSAAARTLRLIPHADLANFDPIWSTAYIARNAALLVWDTLYGVDKPRSIGRNNLTADAPTETPPLFKADNATL